MLFTLAESPLFRETRRKQGDRGQIPRDSRNPGSPALSLQGVPWGAFKGQRAVRQAPGCGVVKHRRGPAGDAGMINVSKASAKVMALVVLSLDASSQ